MPGASGLPRSVPVPESGCVPGASSLWMLVLSPAASGTGLVAGLSELVDAD